MQEQPVARGAHVDDRRSFRPLILKERARVPVAFVTRRQHLWRPAVRHDQPSVRQPNEAADGPELLRPVARAAGAVEQVAGRAEDEDLVRSVFLDVDVALSVNGGGPDDPQHVGPVASESANAGDGLRVKKGAPGRGPVRGALGIGDAGQHRVGPYEGAARRRQILLGLGA